MIPTRPDLLTPEVSVLSRGLYSMMGISFAPRPFLVFMVMSGIESNSSGMYGNRTSITEPLPGVTTGVTGMPSPDGGELL